MKFFLVVVLFVLVGCQHQPRTVFVREVPVHVSASNSLDVIRFPSSYKAYTVGRRHDPSNPAMMHEAHILYVRELPDRWNLQPTAAPGLPAANADGSADLMFSPLPLNEQLRLEVQKQQQLSQTLAEQTERFQKTADALVPAANQAVALTIQIKERQQSLEERLRRLEEIRRPTTFTNWPSTTNR